MEKNRIRLDENHHILSAVLMIGDTVIATVDKVSNTVSPMHGYYPRHPWAKRAKAWAKRHGYDAPLY